MKKSAIEKIEKEIDEKTKLPYEVKDKIKREVFTNIVVGSVIITYFIFIVLGSVGSVKNVRIIDLNIFSFLFLGIAIFLFEIAYRKDDGKLAVYGIESLVVAIFTLFLPYIIFELDGAHKKYYLMSSIYIAVYYIVKSIYISTKTKSKYMNNISDVKEIVKKEKTKRRIKENLEEIEEPKETKNRKNKVEVSQLMSTAPVRSKSSNRTSIQGDPQQNQPKKAGRPKKETVAKNVKENKKEETISKKRGRPKKTEVESAVHSEQQQEQPKRRGRPKKSETTNNANKPKEEIFPKKRGRPRKAVVSND